MEARGSSCGRPWAGCQPACVPMRSRSRAESPWPEPVGRGLSTTRRSWARAGPAPESHREWERVGTAMRCLATLLHAHTTDTGSDNAEGLTRRLCAALGEAGRTTSMTLATSSTCQGGNWLPAHIYGKALSRTTLAPPRLQTVPQLRQRAYLLREARTYM